jgi:hypothetical protein
MKTLLQMEMSYVREYTPTLRVSLIIFKNLQLKYILHYVLRLLPPLKLVAMI